MKRSKAILWLFLLPLLVPALIFSLRWHQNTRLTNYDAGGFKDLKIGEAAAMKKLAEVVRSGRERGRIRVGWTMVQKTPGPQGSTWLCAVVYDRENQRLYKYVLSPNTAVAYRFLVTQYVNVQDGMIYAVAAEQGLASNLVQHGAVLKRHGMVDWDSNKRGELKLQW